MKTTMESKREKVGSQRDQQLRKQVQVDDQSTLPSSYRSFVAYGGYDEPYCPACQKLLETECGTHTHTHAKLNTRHCVIGSFRGLVSAHAHGGHASATGIIKSKCPWSSEC